MPFQFKRLEIPELVLIEAQAFEDERGFFMEAYKKSEFSDHGIPQVFVHPIPCGELSGVCITSNTPRLKQSW